AKVLQAAGIFSILVTAPLTAMLAKVLQAAGMFSILLTAPLGAMLINHLAPLFLPDASES
ncbi:hypothetical protein T484DRAFT_1789120, partial [Baffinella frigidus]